MRPGAEGPRPLRHWLGALPVVFCAKQMFPRRMRHSLASQSVLFPARGLCSRRIYARLAASLRQRIANAVRSIPIATVVPGRTIVREPLELYASRRPRSCFGTLYSRCICEQCAADRVKHRRRDRPFRDATLREAPRCETASRTERSALGPALARSSVCCWRSSGQEQWPFAQIRQNPTRSEGMR